jgi:hypothetical protein
MAELEKWGTEENGPAGFTADELAQRLGICHRAAMYKLKDLGMAGRVEFCGKRRVRNMAGGINQVPVYRLKEVAS